MSLFPLSSQIDALREYFSRMDIEMLELILDDKNTYNDLNKDVFLQKLETVFDSFKESGDTRLDIYRGECSNCFKRCQGYTLCGNNSAKYLDLLVKEENGEIKDIFYCSELVNYRDFEKTEPYTIQFEPDEAADFVPDEDYLLLVHKCKLAMEDWDDFKGEVISISQMQDWITKHREVYEDCVGYFMYSGHSRFFGFYHDVQTLLSIVSQRKQIQKELNSFHSLNLNLRSGDKELLKWLMKNEDTGLSVTGEISSFVDGSEFRDGKLLVDKGCGLYLSEEEFSIFFEYEFLFSKYYNEKLREYSIYSNEEIDGFEPETEEFQKAGSLKFHIEQRQRSGFSL